MRAPEETAIHVLAIVATVFGIIALAELPDKSMFASLVLSTRYGRLPVFAGAACALTVHVAIAVAAGQLLTLLPRQLLSAVVAVLFLGGAAYLLISSVRHSDDHGEADAARLGAAQPSFARIFGTTFGIIFLAEWGDITQITVANFAARYADPVAVGRRRGPRPGRRLGAGRERRRQEPQGPPDGLDPADHRHDPDRLRHLQRDPGHHRLRPDYTR